MTISSSPRKKRGWRGWVSCLAGILCLTGALFPAAQAAEPEAAVDTSNVPYYQNSMEKLTSWNVLRGYPDGGYYPDLPITRAEFVAMLNRAYGYNKSGETPFKDVPADAWYAGDIAIGYTAGYFTGTSPNTASPELTLTREQAMVILARCMRLEETAGEEVTAFTDGRDFSSFSQGYINAAVEHGLVNGLPDGTFRPKEQITRGQMAQMLDNAVGNLVQESGEHTLGGTFGNVTVSTSDVTLKDATVAGDLYIAGGVDLNGVVLDNVKVLGRIVVVASGVSEGGEDSVILRNVNADGMLVDTLANQYVSLRAEGNTVIPNTNVRTDTYLQDRTRTGYGLLNISLDGSTAGNNTYSLSGNLKNVVNRAPLATLNVSQGTLDTLTMDEKGPDAKLVLGKSTVITNLNLDVGVPVTGEGDIGKLTVNAAGSSTAMLPDQVVIRPSVTANVDGTTMDTTVGSESSENPRLLAGFPSVRDVAPTTATAVFSANKSGKLYWAVSSLTDGSIREDELISPSSYGSKAIKGGNLQLSGANAEKTAKVSGLTAGGSYYLSAVVVDARGIRSPVKVVSFTTPDNTVPSFATGYPTMSLVTNIDAQVAVMTNKDCQLYYALMPKNSTAPTPSDFRTANLSGNKGFGVESMIRNVPDYITVSNGNLVELETYDLYLWLTDADGAKSSSVRKLTFKTADRTPPLLLTPPTVNSVKATSLGFVCNANENCTLFWVIVDGEAEYPKPPIGGDPLTVEYAQLQISSGMNGIKSGKVNLKANKDATFTVTGLKPEYDYKLFYVAQDTAGNYSVITDVNDTASYSTKGNTLDNTPPKVTQEFTRYSGTDVNTPYADTNIRIVFSERVQYDNTEIRADLLDLYNHRNDPKDEDGLTGFDKLANALRDSIKLYNVTGTNVPELVPDRSAKDYKEGDPWTIDYRNAVVEYRDHKLTVTFPTNDEELDKSALNLHTGSTYYFQVDNISDVSSAQNRMGVTALPRFTTISAQVMLDSLNLFGKKELTDANGMPIDSDAGFSLTPVSTSKVDSSIGWDMLIWSDTNISFELYTRTRNIDPDVTGPENIWKQVESTTHQTVQSITIPNGSKSKYEGVSLVWNFRGRSTFDELRSLEEDTIYDYGIRILSVNGSTDRAAWTDTVNLRVSIVAGYSDALMSLATSVTEANYADAMKAKDEISDVGVPIPFNLRAPFMDTEPPRFVGTYPTFEPYDTGATMNVMLNRNGTVFYVVAPVDKSDSGYVPIINTKRDIDGVPTDVLFEDVPEQGSEDSKLDVMLSVPSYLNIVNADYSSNNRIRQGQTPVTGGSEFPIEVKDLEPEQDYYVYFVLKGAGQVYSSVYLYRFTTTEITRPVITLERTATSTVKISSDRKSDVDYILVTYTQFDMLPMLTQPFSRYCLEGTPDQFVADEKFTVLEAASTLQYDPDGKCLGSVFDLYASTDAKNDLAEYIRAASVSSGSTGGIRGTGNASITEKKPVSVQCDKQMSMAIGTQYVFLAVGKSPLGSGDAFHAIYPIIRLDEAGPKVIAATGDIWTKEQGTDGKPDTYTGRVRLQFNSEIYYYDSTTGGIPRIRAIDIGPILTPVEGSEKRDDQSFVSAVTMVSPSSNTPDYELLTEPSEVNKKTNTLVFKFQNLQANSNRTFTFRYPFANEFGVQTSPALSVTVQIWLDEDNLAHVIASVPAAWDAIPK